MASLFDKVPATMSGAVHTLGSDRKKWAKDAKLDWEIVEGPAITKYKGKTIEFKGRKMLLRSDDLTPLSIVGSGYKVVQPADLIAFYEEIAAAYGFTLACAGEVTHGRKMWAIAETPHTFEAIKGDKVGGLLLMMTGCDGGLSTQGMFTSQRPWCFNQLPLPFNIYSGKALDAPSIAAKARSLGKAESGAVRLFRQTHSKVWDPKTVQQELQLMDGAWKNFETAVKTLAKTKVSKEQAVRYFLDLFYKPKEGEKQEEVTLDALNENHTVVKVLQTYENGPGQKQIAGTAWGLVNAVTRHLDHETKAADASTRIRHAWIEDGMRLKTRAFADALVLMARK